MSTTEARHSSTKNGLYSEFCRTKSQTKPKIKEIITLAAKNLLDLTSCLVQIHKSINHPKYSSLSISKILDYEIESWHNELLSCGLSTRRNLSRLMTDLKYMLSSINGTEALFMDISKVTKIMKKNWDREMYKRTGNELKSNMLDIVLLIDPQIKGEDVQEENYELINRRISQLTDQTKSVFQEQLGGFRGVSQVTGRTDNSGYQSTVYDIERRDQVKQLVRETAEKDKHCHPAPSQASVSRNDSKDRLRYRLNEQLNQGTSGGLSSHGMSNMAYDTENSDFRVGASSIMSKVGSNNLKNRKFLIQQKKASNTTSQSSLRMPSLHKQRSHKVFSPNTVINSQATSVYRLDQFVIDDDREPRDIKKPVVTESISNPMATNSGYVQDKSKNSTPKKLLNKSLIGDRIVTPDPDSKKIAKPNPNCVYQPKPGALKVVTNQILNSGKKIGHNRSKKKIVSENIRSSKDLPHVFHNAVGQRENQENYPQISFQEKGYAEHSGFDLNKSSINKQHLAARENQRKAKALFESKATFGPIDRGSYLENDQNLQKSMLAVGIDPRSNNNSGQTLIGSSGMSFNHHISSGASSSHQNHLIQKIEVKGISQDGHSHPRQKEFQDENYDYANKTKVKSRSEWPKKASKSPTDSRILETNGSYNNCYKQPGGSQGVYRPGESRFGGRNGASYGNLHHPRPTEFRTATELQANPRSTEKCRGGLNHPHDRPCRPQDRIHNYEEPSQHPEPRTSNCFHKKRNPDLKGSRVLSEARHVNQNLSKVYFNSKENLGGDLVGHSMRYINKYQLANDELVSQPYHPSSTPNKVDKQFGNFSTLTPLRYSNNSLSPFSLEMKRKMIKETNFDIKKFLGNRDSEKIHVNLKGIQKVVLSNDQQYLIFGGEGLNVLDMRDDNFRIVRHDKHKQIVYNAIKILKSNNIMVTEPISNDLVIYNTHFKEMKRLKGIEGPGFDNEAIRNASSSNEGDHYIWYKGGRQISIVDPRTFDCNEICMIQEDSLPVATGVNKGLTKMVVLSVTEDSRIFLNFWQEGASQIISKEITKICSKLKAAMTLEVSEDGEFIFIAGCDRMNVEEGNPVVSALTFDTTMREIDSLRLHADSMKNIFRIKRLEGSNVLFLSGFEILSLVEFRDRDKFVELKQLRGLHSGEIFDFVLKGREIFSVSGTDTYIHKF